MLQDTLSLIYHKAEQLEKKYKKEISALAEKRCVPAEFYRLLEVLESDCLNGNNYLLPYYYILHKDYQVAWILLNYLNLKFMLHPGRFAYYHPNAKQELESTVHWDMRPLWAKENEDTKLLLRHGTTCFRLKDDYDLSAIQELKVGHDKEEVYDLSPEARFRTVDKIKNIYLSPETFYEVSRLMEIYFRQEKISETEECLFRLRHIASAGEPGKHLMEHPTSRHMSAWVNMYDYWYQARCVCDPQRRKTLATLALYWFLELGLRLVGNNKIDTFMHFSVGCEIIGEFDLMGEDQENFLRHLKRFVMHASVSFCKKMLDSPIELVPFSERNMPGYEEYQEIVRKLFYEKDS